LPILGSCGIPSARLPASDAALARTTEAPVDPNDQILQLLQEILANQKAEMARRRRGVRTSFVMDLVALAAFIAFVVLILTRRR
jgi:hypothetical protein